MARRRGRSQPLDLCSGPGKLCRAMGVDRAHDGEDLVRGRVVWIEAGSPVAPEEVAAGVRVGISSGLDREWRFRVAGDPFVSRGRPGPAPRGRTPRS
jgi:DNA-3-methyladenine glycosylase